LIFALRTLLSPASDLQTQKSEATAAVNTLSATTVKVALTPALRKNSIVDCFEPPDDEAPSVAKSGNLGAEKVMVMVLKSSSLSPEFPHS